MPPSPSFEISAPPFNRLQRWFEKEGIPVVPAREDQLSGLEARCGVTLPETFRAYLAALAPAEAGIDSEYGTWWSVERIRTVPQEVGWGDPAHALYLIFADHCHWCWAWAIACTNDENRGRIMLVDGHRFVADSFDEFIDKYLTDNGSVC